MTCIYTKGRIAEVQKDLKEAKDKKQNHKIYKLRLELKALMSKKLAEETGYNKPKPEYVNERRISFVAAIKNWFANIVSSK